MTRKEWEAMTTPERVAHNRRCAQLKCEPDGKPWRYKGEWPDAIYQPWTPDDWRDE